MLLGKSRMNKGEDKFNDARGEKSARDKEKELSQKSLIVIAREERPTQSVSLSIDEFSEIASLCSQ